MPRSKKKTSKKNEDNELYNDLDLIIGNMLRKDANVDSPSHILTPQGGHAKKKLQETPKSKITKKGKWKVKPKKKNNCGKLDLKEAVMLGFLEIGDKFVLNRKDYLGQDIHCKISENYKYKTARPFKHEFYTISNWTYMWTGKRGGILNKVVLERTGETLQDINKNIIQYKKNQ